MLSYLSYLNETTIIGCIETFFDNNLTQGLAYGPIISNPKPFTEPPEDGYLVYQDNSGSSSAFTYLDVFLMPDQTYFVKIIEGGLVVKVAILEKIFDKKQKHVKT